MKKIDMLGLCWEFRKYLNKSEFQYNGNPRNLLVRIMRNNYMHHDAIQNHALAELPGALIK